MSASQSELFPAHPSIAEHVEKFIRTLLAGAARPSAGELLRAIERTHTANAREHFEAVLKVLLNDKSLRRHDNAYLQSMLADGSVRAALRGKGKADEETISSI